MSKARARQAGIPRDLLSRVVQVDKAVYRIEVPTSSEQENVVNKLQAAGFQLQESKELRRVLVKPKKLGGQEIAFMLIGLFCLVLPAVIYFLIWSQRPNPVVVVEIVE